MRLNKGFLLLHAVVFIFLLHSCKFGSDVPEAFTVMSYNLQTLFDAKDDGGEYSDFKVSSGKWNAAKYKTRLNALSSVILSASHSSSEGKGPSILVVQELENERVAKDLASSIKEAGGTEYPYIIVSPEEEATLSCAILSKYPITNAKAHRVRKLEDGSTSVPRFILEVNVQIGTKQLVIIGVHLKSKLGGAEQTEPERIAASQFLRAIVSGHFETNPNTALLIAGDFNENPDEFMRVEFAWPTAIMDVAYCEDTEQLTDKLLISGSVDNLNSNSTKPVLYSPWFNSDGYSYKYKGVEERIDNIFLSQALLMKNNSCPFLFESFVTKAPEFSLHPDGTPIEWNSKTSSGYSDHLPISIVLRLK